MKFFKRGGMELDTLVVLIIVILIILLAAYLIFNNNILNWFGNLPGHEEGKDKLVDKLDEDLEIKLNYYKVAVVKEGSRISFCTEGDCSILRDSNLYIEGSEDNGEIYVRKEALISFSSYRQKVASIINGRISLVEGIDLGENKIKQLPSKKDMLNLDNSIYISGIIYRDKKLGESSETKIDESRNLFFSINGLFKNKVFLRYNNGWQWSQDSSSWLGVGAETHMDAKNLKINDIEAYNFLISLKSIGYDAGLKSLLDKIVSNRGNKKIILKVDIDNSKINYNFNSDSPEIGNYGIFIRTIGVDKYE